MSKFDTHGGVFAPQGYMRVNAGGSHEENPNGGVQVGVDPEGVPNVLEEGEPVYNDYVYSDNIVAEKAILEKHNIPVKYAGKLYSVIADTMVDAVAEMPLDPIANNGLEEMLVRLADAQEEQKAIEQQKELEKELESMSPEELAELEQMLAEQEAAAQPQQPMMMPQEQVPMQEPQMQPDMQDPMMLQQPMMACGGKIRRFDIGGPTDDLSNLLLEAARLGNSKQQMEEARIAYENALSSQGSRRFWQAVNPFNAERALNRSRARLANLESAIISQAESDPESLSEPVYTDRLRTAYTEAQKDVKRKEARAERSRKKDAALRDSTLNAVQKYEAAKRNYKGMLPEEEIATEPAVDTTSIVVESPTDTITVAAPAQPVVTTMNIVDDKLTALEKKLGLKALGGKINRYDWGSFLNQVRNYTGSRTKSTDRHYRIDPNFYKRYGFNSIEDLENSEPYKAFTRYVLANSNNPEVLDYLRAIDAGVAQDNNVPMLFDENGNLKKGWEKQYIDLRNDQKGGIYHFMGDTADDYNNLSGLFNDNAVTPAMVRALEDEPIVDEILSVNGYQPTRSRVTPGDTMLREIVDDARVGNTNPFSDTTLRREQRALPTWPRYAGAITSGLLGLHNVFQEPDRYDMPHIQPVLPYGRMHLVDPVYNPLDQNQVTNDLLANSAGTTRGLMYSAQNPSVPTTLLAQDYNTGRNMGNAATTVWDANNQRRNAVIAAHNQNAGTLGNFHYGQNRDRAQILNGFAQYNAGNDWRNQYMNYQAEAQKYAAIQQQLENLSEALAAIGQENFATNQLRNNRALYYKPGYGGRIYYDPYTGESLV